MRVMSVSFFLILRYAKNRNDEQKFGLLFSHRGHCREMSPRNRVVSKQWIQSKLLAGKKKANCKKSRAGKKKKQSYMVIGYTLNIDVQIIIYLLLKIDFSYMGWEKIHSQWSTKFKHVLYKKNY